MDSKAQNAKKLLDTVKDKFHSKLNDILSKNVEESKGASSILNHVWILNQTFTQYVTIANSTFQCGNVKIRFLPPEHNSSTLTSISKSLHLYLDQVSLKEEEQFASNFSLNVQNIKLEPRPNIKNTSNKGSKSIISCLRAFNYQGVMSVPLITHPRLDLDSTLPRNLQRMICVEETSNGELGELSTFIKWLQMFIEQQRQIHASQRPPIILITNATLYALLIRTAKDKTQIDNFVKFCIENNVFLLFYPVDTIIDPFQTNISTKLKENFKHLITLLSSKDNPNTFQNFILTIKQSMRTLTKEYRKSFRQLITEYPLSFADLTETIMSNEETTSETTTDLDQSRNMSQNNVTTVTYALSDEELLSLTDWVNQMSAAGCLCLRYIYLREVYVKQRGASAKLSSRKEFLAGERRWIDLSKKIYPKLTSEACSAKNENQFMLKWFNTDFWRMSYYNRVKKQTPVESPDSLWTFDIFEFPYSVNNQLGAPKRDYQRRPRNNKSKLSVIFAFNAAGDYLQPYFVYPTSFTTSEEIHSISESECFSHNGYVNCRVFETWLQSSFIPYLNKSPKGRQNILLLFCAKLAVIDDRNLKICNQNENRIDFFCLSHENQMPFNLIFQKNLRKRQIDLFADSWRKVISKQNLSYQFKCKSKQEFFNLFMDAFQNCIEEIGNNNNNEQLNTSSSSGVIEFRNKMSSAFETCLLWPVNDEDYKEFIDNGTKFVQEMCNNNNNDKARTGTEAETEEGDEDDTEEEEEDTWTANMSSQDDENENESASDLDTLEPNNKRRRIGSSTQVNLNTNSRTNLIVNNNNGQVIKRGRKSKVITLEDTLAPPNSILTPSSSTLTPSSSTTTLSDVINKKVSKRVSLNENMVKPERGRPRKSLAIEPMPNKDLIVDLLGILLEEKSNGMVNGKKTDPITVLRMKVEKAAHESSDKIGFLKNLCDKVKETRLTDEERPLYLKHLADLLCEAYNDKKFMAKENGHVDNS